MQHLPRRRASAAALGTLVAGLAAVLAACDAAAPDPTAPIEPGTAAAPREVNIVARDYAYVPSVVDLVPGETVVIHVVNGGLDVHEAIVADLADQLAWEAAEAPHADPPPGPTPTVDEPAGWDGVRAVAASGERVDIAWTVPADAPAAAGGWFVGCHIPGHWAKGMVVPVRFVGEDGVPLAPVPSVPGASGDS
jgi:hypothetical protein